MENSTCEDHSEKSSADLGSASLPPSLTAQTRGSSLDHRERQPADLRSVPCHSVAAQTGGSAVVPQLHGCSVGGDIHFNVNIPSHNPGVENRGDTAWIKQSQAVTSGDEHEPAKHHGRCNETEPGETQTDAPSQQRIGKTNAINRDKEMLKSDLKKKIARVFEGLAKQKQWTHLDEIYTELYITEGGSGGVNTEHEMRQIETACRRQASQESAIACNDIFKPTSGDGLTIRTVLTKGITGIGKTVSVQKFILDWAEGKANQDIDFIFTLPFRDLNLKKGENFSLMALLQHYFPELTFQNHFSQEDIKSFDRKVKVLLIFDGLDECRLPLDFQKNEMWFDVTKANSVEKLLTNLILGNLLPSALLWITCRPAAASQIPLECIHRVTEVRGFNDTQKEEYFKKRFKDQDLAGRVISHIKSSRSLYIMCHIPVLCWISATVLEPVFNDSVTVLPKSQTEMYTHFLLFQINMNKKKYQGTNEKNSKNISASDVEMILKLGKLAFFHLKKGTLIFDEQDLRRYGIDVTKASVYSGLCTQIFQDDSGLYQEDVYCFVHLSIQEYLAALFVFHSFKKGNINLLTPDYMQEKEDEEEDGDAEDSDRSKEESYPEESPKMPLSNLYCCAVDEALKSKNGHLDLFLQFLLGLSQESTQELLHDFLKPTGSGSVVSEQLRHVTNSIMLKLNLVESFESKSHAPEPRRTSAFQKMFNKFRKPSKDVVSEKIGLAKSPSNIGDSLEDTILIEDPLRKTGGISQCTEVTVRYIAEKINEQSTAERILNMFHCLNELADNSLVEKIQSSLRSGSFSRLRLDPGQCSALVYVLLMSEEVLDVFDLKMYNTSVAGQLRLLTVVKHCRRAMLSDCNLTEKSSEIVASALQLDLSPLVQLDFTNNDLGDSGVELLCAGLQNSNCKLEILRLSGCQVTERGCAYLASALHSNPSHLRELDLSYNHPGESGVIELTAGVEDPSWRLEKLNVDHGGQIRLKPGLRKYACQLTLDPNTAHRELSLSEGNKKATHSGLKEEPCPDHAERFDSYRQVLCREGLTGRSYWEMEWRQEDPKKWKGLTAVGVAYKGISRKLWVRDGYLGGSKNSWSLELDRSRPLSRHDGTCRPISESSWGSSRVGVYLDWSAGTLSFYGISSGTLTHLHTFHTTFTEPVYPAFRVASSSSISLCMLG